jgi:hypothetical protein
VKNLAHTEMRQILAEMIWLFELKPVPRWESVMDGCKMFTLWKNLALAVGQGDCEGLDH